MIHVRAGLFDGDAGLQAADGVHAHADAPVAESGIGPLADGDVKIGRTKAGDTALGHADDGVRFAVQRDALPQDVRRQSKFALPKSVAEDGHRTGARLVFFRMKIAAEQRLQAESEKKFSGNHVNVDALRLAGANQIVVVGAESA